MGEGERGAVRHRETPLDGGDHQASPLIGVLAGNRPTDLVPTGGLLLPIADWDQCDRSAVSGERQIAGKLVLDGAIARNDSDRALDEGPLRCSEDPGYGAIVLRPESIDRMSEQFSCCDRMRCVLGTWRPIDGAGRGHRNGCYLLGILLPERQRGQSPRI